jgi:hypothetical protein
MYRQHPNNRLMAHAGTDPAVAPYRVTRRSDGPGYVRIALVRGARDHGRDCSQQPETVLAQRTFRASLELFELESYAAKLERAAEHGNRGTLGCFVQIEPIPDGTVRVTLYERWFIGRHLLCEQLASREFDARKEDDVPASAAYLLDLQHQAAQRNDQREAAAAAAAAEDTAAVHRRNNLMTAAERLADLLNDLNSASTPARAEIKLRSTTSMSRRDGRVRAWPRT